MFEICEFCPVIDGAKRTKRLPIGNADSSTLVILAANEKTTTEFLEVMRDVFGEAYIVFRRACLNVDAADGNLCCGILIRNIISNYKILVMPRSMTKEFLGVEITGSLVEYKTGQLVIAYDGKPTAIEVQREYERAVKQ